MPQGYLWPQDQPSAHSLSANHFDLISTYSLEQWPKSWFLSHRVTERGNSIPLSRFFSAQDRVRPIGCLTIWDRFSSVYRGPGGWWVTLVLYLFFLFIFFSPFFPFLNQPDTIIRTRTSTYRCTHLICPDPHAHTLNPGACIMICFIVGLVFEARCIANRVLEKWCVCLWWGERDRMRWDEGLI
jgi:hypothetical protein